MVTSVDGVGHTGLQAWVEEVVHLVLAVGIVGEGTALPKTFTPNLGKLCLQAQIKVEVSDEPVDLVPNAAVVAVGVLVVYNDIAHLGYMVRIQQVGLTLV